MAEGFLDDDDAQKTLWYQLYQGEAPAGAYDEAFGEPFIEELSKICGARAVREDLETGLEEAIEADQSNKNVALVSRCQNGALAFQR